MFEAAVLAPGSCGELVQGTVDGLPFHISCPVDLFSRVEVSLGPATPLNTPTDCPKASLALSQALHRLGGEDWGGRLAITSPIPRGKGMASSTADIMGAVDATCLALGRRLQPEASARGLSREEVAGIALSIEPSDGTLFPGVVLFDHREGKWLEYLGAPPALGLIALDFGGEVDTLEFNRIDRRPLLRPLEPQIGEAMALVREGLLKGDAELIGEGATLSALANQRVLFKEPLERVIALGREVGGVGVNVAHSGTVIGILFDPGRVERGGVARYLSGRLPGLQGMFPCSLIGGGSRPIEEVRDAPAGSDIEPDKAPE